MNYLFVLLGFAIGLVVGFIITKLYIIFHAHGVLRIDTSDPNDQPYMFVELAKSPIEVKKQAYVIFRVNPNNYLPHD